MALIRMGVASRVHTVAPPLNAAQRALRSTGGPVAEIHAEMRRDYNDCCERLTRGGRCIFHHFNQSFKESRQISLVCDMGIG